MCRTASSACVSRLSVSYDYVFVHELFQFFMFFFWIKNSDRSNRIIIHKINLISQLIVYFSYMQPDWVKIKLWFRKTRIISVLCLYFFGFFSLNSISSNTDLMHPSLCFSVVSKDALYIIVITFQFSSKNN